MTATLKEVTDLIGRLSAGEKAQVLSLVASDLSTGVPGIESLPGVSGGEPCVIRTRIPVWLLEQARRLGTSESQLLRAYPTLRAEDLAHAWAYARANSEQIDREIRDNEEA